MRFARTVLAWLLATVVTTVTGSIIQTQFNLAAIVALGAPVPLPLRVQTTLHDLGGFAPAFALITGMTFILAFLAAFLLLHRRPARHRLLFTLAGGVGIASALLLMNAVLPVTAIAATRSFWGFAALATAGGLGGWAFAQAAPRPRAPAMA